MIMGCKFSRRAYTLVDCLAVLAVLAAGAALLLPAIARSSAAARKEGCHENLRVLGKAFQEFEQARGGFPPRRTGLGGSQPYGGWGSQLLPNLDEKLHANYHYDRDFYDPLNKEVSGTRVPAFLCASAPPERFTLIQANASGNSANPDKDTLFETRCAPNDYLASNGLFIPRGGYGLSWPRAIGGGNQHQAMTDSENLPTSRITDGLSNTYLIIERAGGPQKWRMGKKEDDRDLFAGQNISRGTWAGFGSLNYGVFDPKTGEQEGARGDDTDCVVNCNNTFGIYSFHEGGANVLLCDGSVRFVGKSLDGLTHLRLTTRDDGQLILNADW
jgi:prepilin-type processing-associated H-X9-DG protein